MVGSLQVFDKALTETTFCEMYAELCSRLSTALPNFAVPSQDANKRSPSTFRSALHLSPCIPLAHIYNRPHNPCVLMDLLVHAYCVRSTVRDHTVGKSNTCQTGVC